MQHFVWEIFDNRKHIKVCKKTRSQNRQMSYFSPLCQIQSSISQNRPVRLVACFVGVHNGCTFLTLHYMWYTVFIWGIH